MKQTIKIISLILAMGLISGCNLTPSSRAKSSAQEESSAQVISELSSKEEESSQKSSEQKSSSKQEQSSQGGGASSSQQQSSQGGGAASSSQQQQSSQGGGAASSSKQQQSSQGGGQASEGFTFNDTELNTPQEIHTANQKKYLNLNMEYYHITGSDLSSCGASGTSNVSTPNKVTVKWDYTAPSGKTVSKFQLLYGQKADLTDAYTVEGSASKQVSFYNPYLGDNYFKVVANFSDGSKEESPIKVFKVDSQAPRNISAGNMPNVRDMGGRVTYAGGKIKQGLIYRGAGNRFDNSSSINTDCQNVLSKQLKIKTEINVANSTGNNINLSGVKVVNAYMDYGSTPYSNLARNAERIRQVMDVLADQSNYPVFYHCRIGTDRTGITGMMIGGLLGIPFNEVFQDYCFSNFAPIDGQRFPNKPSDPNGDDPAKYIDEILAMPGRNYQEQTYNALLSIGCKAETLNTIINIMTEGAKAELPTNVIGRAENLSSTGTKKTDSEYKNPATYYELGSNKTATLTAELTAGEKDIVVYLGSTDSSNSKKLASGISLKIDGAEQTIVDKTYFLAGFGKTGQNGRTGYMFNLLGKYNLTAGSHEITITVKSGTFYLGTICVFDHVTAA